MIEDSKPVRIAHVPGSLPPEWELKDLHDELDDLPVDALACDGDRMWLADQLVRMRDGVLAGPRPYRLVQDGPLDNYDRTPLFRPVSGGRFDQADLVDEGRVDSQRALVTAYETLASSGIPLQLSRPCHLDSAMFTVAGKPTWRRPLRTLNGARLALRNLSAYRAAGRREIEVAREHAATMGLEASLRWSLETPGVLYALSFPLGPARRLVVRWLAARVADALSDIPDGRAVLHLCYGRLNGEAIAQPDDMAPITEFLNALGPALARVRVSRPAVHVPVVVGQGTPPLNPTYYESLARLDKGWRLIAGLAHPEAMEDSRKALRLLESTWGQPVWGVSTSCGWGDWDAARARRAFDVLRALRTAGE